MKCRLHYVMMEQSFRGYALDSHEASALGGNMPATYGKRWTRLVRKHQP